MLCFTILGENDALKSDEQNPAKTMPLSSGMFTDVVIPPFPVPLRELEWCVLQYLVDMRL